MKTRTFIAVGVNDEIRAGALLAIEQLRATAPSFRWVAEENLHYTLHFLGDLTDQEVVDVCARVNRVADSCEPFSLQAAGVGAFPSVDRPRTLWVGAGRGAQEMIALQEALGQQLLDLGFRGENRRFVPHLTIGKLSGRGGRPPTDLASDLEKLATLDAGSMLVDQVTVFASKLHRDGPEYHVLARCDLVGA